MPKRPVKTEIERIDKLLSGELTNKQRFALVITREALKWQSTIKKKDVPEPPSKKIMANGG